MRNRHVRMAVLAALSSAGALTAAHAAAEGIALDGTLPGTLAGALDSVNGTYNITQNDGFLNGPNLFHSFKVFDLNAGETAVFSGNAAIANIISRVTGGQPSLIDGTIRSSIDGANFWFVNPAGLTIGPNGVIDVSGAIALGAADAIDFADGRQFFALPQGEETAVSLLVSSPLDFGFLPDSSARTLVIQSSDLLNRQVQPRADNLSLLLSGGDGVFLRSEGDLRLQGARIRTDGTVATGAIDISAAGSITLANSDLLTSNAVDAPGGNIFIQGGELVTISHSNVVAQSFETGVPTGEVSIKGAGVLISDQSLVATKFSAAATRDEADPDKVMERIGAGGIAILASGRSSEVAPQSQLSTASAGAVRIVDSAVLVGNAGGRNLPGAGGIRIGRVDQFSATAPRVIHPEAPLAASFGADHVVIAGSMIATDATAEGAADDILLGGRQGVWITSSTTGGYRDDGKRLDATSSISARASNTARASGQISVQAGAAGVSIDRATLDTSSAVPGDEEFSRSSSFDFDDVFFSDIDVLSSGRAALDNATLRTDSTGIKAAGGIGILADTVRINGGQLTTSVSALRPRDQPGFGYSAGDIEILATNRSLQPAALVIENGAALRANSTNNGDPLTDPVGAAAGSIRLMSPRGTLRVSDALLESASNGANGGSGGQVRMQSRGDLDVADTVINVAALSQNPNAFTSFSDVGAIDLMADEGAVAVARSEFTATSSGVGQAGDINVRGTTVDILDSRFETSSAGEGAAGGIDVGARGAFFGTTDTVLRIINSSLTSSSVGGPMAVAGDIALQTGSGGIEIDKSTFNTSVLSDGNPPGPVFGGLAAEASILISTGQAGTLKITDSSLSSMTSSAVNAGSILIDADAIALRGATLSTSSDAPKIEPPDPDVFIFAPQLGNAGLISIQVTRQAAPGDLSQAFAPSPLTIESSSITTNAAANRGGDIAIGANGNTLLLRGSSLVASAGGTGTGGNISISGAAGATIQDTEVLALAESGTAGTVDIALTEGAAAALLIDRSRIATNATDSAGGSIALDAAGAQVLLRSSSIVASAGGSGQGGDIAIRNARGATLQDTQMQALANAGSGGTISIDLAAGQGGALVLDNSSITTNATAANGGNISLDAAGNQVVLRGSSVVASAGGTGMGGGISIVNAGGTTLQDSQLQALADAGSGGTINIDLASAAVGAVTLHNSSITTNAVRANGGSISLEVEGKQVQLQGSSIVASAGGIGTGGSIAILNAGGVSLQDSQVQALADAGSGGTISIDLGDAPLGPVALDNSSITTNALHANGGNISVDAAGQPVTLRNSSIVASAGGTGTGGSIAILNAGGTSLQDSQVQALANAGAGGTISILQAQGLGAVVLDNSSITTNATAANGGNISLDAAGSQVTLRNSSIVASAGGAGTGGNISITNAGGTTLQGSQLQALAQAGTGGTINITQASGLNGAVLIDSSAITTNATDANGGSIALDAAGNQVVLRNSSIVASAGGSGTGGGISILNAGGATLQNSQVQALANAGAGGTISIDLADGTRSLVIDNSSITTNAAAANGGNILLDAAGNAVVLRGSTIVASAGGNGAGGDISIRNAGGALLQDTQIQALANAGAGGTISVSVVEGAGPVVIQKSTITTNAVAAGGGNIALDAGGNQLVLRDSTILASAGAAGTGGSILIDNLGFTLMQRSQVLARADAGNGGTITLNLNDGALLAKDAQSTISADSNSGNDGQVDINSPDTDLNPAVKLQDATLASTPELSANPCAPARDAARSTFVRESRGGVRASPDGYLASFDTATDATPKAASAATLEAIQVAMTAANAPPTEGCR